MNDRPWSDRSGSRTISLETLSEDAALAALQGKAEAQLLEAAQSAERLVGAASRQRGALDALGERQRALDARLGDMRAARSRLSEAQLRLGVVALNAGLEGARIEGAAGRALVLVAEEIRSQSARAQGASREIQTSLEEASAELALLDADLGKARAGGAQIGDASTLALSLTHQAHQAMRELGDRIRTITGLDAEMALAVTSVESHARELAGALDRIAARSDAAIAGALRPSLASLTGLLQRLVDTADQRPTRPTPVPPASTASGEPAAPAEPAHGARDAAAGGSGVEGA